MVVPLEDTFSLGRPSPAGSNVRLPVLATHGITGHFVTLQTADRHPSKPHPAMLEAALFEAGASREQAVMIGDTSFDMLMARSIGVAGIGVGWGYHAAPELLASGAARVVGTAEALAAALEEALP